MYFLGTVFRKRKQTKAKPRNVHKWTAEEIDEIDKIFKSFRSIQKTPGEADIRIGMFISEKRNGLIHKLPVVKIKKKISWLNNRHKHTTMYKQ